MGLFSKTGNSTWKSASKIFVKTSNTSWKTVLKGFVKTAGGWLQFWPTTGPEATRAPYFSNDTAGNNEPSGYTIPFNSTVYGQRGTWISNSSTNSISSYVYSVITYDSDIDNQTNPISTQSGTMSSTYVTVPLTDATKYDGKYISLNVTATRSDGASGQQSSDAYGYRYKVIRNIPEAPAGYSPSVSSTTTQTTTTLSGGLLLTQGGTFTLGFSGYWRGSASYLPNNTRSTIKWFRSTTLYSTAASVLAYATEITNSPTSIITIDAPYVTSNIYYTGSTLVYTGIPSGSYIYAVNTEFNSGTDYTYGTLIGESQFAYVGPINPSPTTSGSNQPTITCTTPAGYIGNQNSFTVGGTVTGWTGIWDPVPNSSQSQYPVISSFKYSSGSSITNQANWSFVGVSGYQTSGIQDTSHNRYHSFVLPALTTDSVGLVGKYLEYSISATNGGGNTTYSDFYTNSQKVYQVPYPEGAPVLSWTADNQATVYWPLNLNSSYSYQLEYSANGTSGWIETGTRKTTRPSSGSQFLYTGLPSGYQYYRVVSYNEDGVGIAGSGTTYYNSTPPAYTFSTGNTLYVSTNGYISFDNAQSYDAITATSGRVIGFLPNDLVQDYISYAAVRIYGEDYFVILWQGHGYNQSNTANLKVEFWFKNGVPYGWAKYTISSPPSPLVNQPGGFYKDGLKISPGTSSISNGADINWWFNANSNTLALPDFTYKGNSWNGWYTFAGSNGITSGTTDVGYFAINTFAPAAPSAPINVQATNITGSSATISWNAPSYNGSTNYITSYDYSINNGAWTSASLNTAVSIVSGLNNYGGSNTIRIRANNESGVTSTNYGTVTFNTNAVPSAPTTLSASTNRTDGVQLTWDSVPGANYYEIYWQNTQGTGPVNQSTFADFGQDNSITTNSFLDTTISQGSVRYYRVRARISATALGANCSDWYPAPSSNAIYGSRIVPVPGTPTVTWSSTASSFTFNVTFGINTTKCTVEYGTSTSYGSSSADVTSSGGSSTPVGPFASGTTYYYRITPYNGTTPGTAVTGSLDTRPLAPTSFSASDSTFTDRIRLTWTAPSGALKHQIWYNSTSTGYPPSQFDPTTGYDFEDTDGSPYDDFQTSGTTRYYWIRAVRNTVTSAWQPAINAAGESGTVGTPVVYTVSWNANGGTVTDPVPTSGVSGTVINAPTPTRSGYTFLYWRDSLNVFSYVYQINPGGSWTIGTGATGNITFYAYWQQNVTIPSGGSVTLSGSNTAGSVITASTSGWSGSPTSYDVYITTALSPNTPTSSSTRVAQSNGGSSTSYTITSSDAISPVNVFRAFATATNAAGTSGTVQSSNTITTQAAASGTAPSTPTNGGGSFSTGTNYVTNATFTSSSSGTTPITYSWTVYSSTSSSGPWSFRNSGSLSSSSLSASLSIPQQSWNQSSFGSWAQYNVAASNSIGSSPGTLTWVL